MKLISIVLALAIVAIEFFGEANCDESYTYDISATRTSQTIAPGIPVLYMYYQVTPEQNLTFFGDYGPDKPFILETYLSSSDGATQSSASDLNVCTDYKDGWEYVAVEIFRNGIIPDGGCSVKKGSYMVHQAVSPFSATLPEKISCGDYSLVMNAYVGTEWACQLEFAFTIVDDGKCIRG